MHAKTTKMTRKHSNHNDPMQEESLVMTRNFQVLTCATVSSADRYALLGSASRGLKGILAGIGKVSTGLCTPFLASCNSQNGCYIKHLYKLSLHNCFYRALTFSVIYVNNCRAVL